MAHTHTGAGRCRSAVVAGRLETPHGSPTEQKLGSYTAKANLALQLKWVVPWGSVERTLFQSVAAATCRFFAVNCFCFALSGRGKQTSTGSRQTRKWKERHRNKIANGIHSRCLCKQALQRVPVHVLWNLRRRSTSPQTYSGCMCDSRSQR